RASWIESWYHRVRVWSHSEPLRRLGCHIRGLPGLRGFIRVHYRIRNGFDSVRGGTVGLGFDCRVGRRFRWRNGGGELPLRVTGEPDDVSQPSGPYTILCLRDEIDAVRQN